MYYILVNGEHLKKRGNGIKMLATVKKVFDTAGKKYEILFTKKTGDAKRYAEKITSEKNENVIVAMGGDGTLHDILNGFKNFDNCALGLIPFGTGNDFAAAAGIPKDAKKAAEIIAYKAPKKIDFIELSTGLRSINSVGTGLDADILKRVYNKKMHGKTKYIRSLLYCLAHFKSCNFTLKYDGKEEKHYGLIAAIGNGIQLGGGIKLFPLAKIDDGFLDLLIVDYISRAQIAGAFIKLMRGKVDKVKNVTFVKTKAAAFVPENENFTVQAEGELYENMPVDAHIEENKLKFFTP